MTGMNQDVSGAQDLLEENCPEVVVVMIEPKLRHNLQSAAALMDCSKSHLRNLVHSGKIGHYREGDNSNKRLYFTRQDLRAYLEGVKYCKAML